MTEWTDYRVAMAEEMEQRLIDQWQDLWKFNGGVEPKFWFGQRVRFYKRSGVIAGMEWRSEDRSYHTTSQTLRLKAGWSYGLLFSPVSGLQWIHEESLSEIANN